LPVSPNSNSNRVLLDPVYLNGLHALRCLRLTNLSADSWLQVRLRSNMGQQVAFQLSNENLPSITTSGDCLARDCEHFTGILQKRSWISIIAVRSLPYGFIRSWMI
jgi:hypothetical protein